MRALASFRLCHEYVFFKKNYVFHALLLCGQFFIMSAGYAANCIVATSPALIFDQYDPMSKLAQDIETSLILQCESSPLESREEIKMSIRLLNGSDNGTGQEMISPENGATLKFTLFMDSKRRVPWDTSMPIQIADVIQGRKIFSVPIFGRIHKNQNASKGQYQTNLSLIITY